MINLFKIMCSHFLRYSEDIRNPKKIFKWNCEKQNNFIEKGRGNDYVYLENRPKKIMANNSQSCANTCLLLMFPQHFLFSQISTVVSTTP